MVLLPATIRQIQWPGGEPSPLAQKIGNIPAPSTALNATDTIWQFFAPNHR